MHVFLMPLFFSHVGIGKITIVNINFISLSSVGLFCYTTF